MPSLTEVNRQSFEPGGWQRLLESAAGGPLPEWDQLADHIELKVLRAGAAVFDQDTTHPYLYAVREGLIKLSYIDENGGEWIKSFASEGRFFASISALQADGRTSFMSTAIEASRLERLPYRYLIELASRHLAWARAAQNLTMLFAARKEARERELLTLTPEGRYRAFLVESPALEKRIAQKDLARYLGLTPVGLNRIASRVRRTSV
jgi:CRP-like cAMP-binding protein